LGDISHNFSGAQALILGYWGRLAQIADNLPGPIGANGVYAHGQVGGQDTRVVNIPGDNLKIPAMRGVN
jgi:hypothetical protein